MDRGKRILQLALDQTSNHAESKKFIPLENVESFEVVQSHFTEKMVHNSDTDTESEQSFQMSDGGSDTTYIPETDVDDSCTSLEATIQNSSDSFPEIYSRTCNLDIENVSFEDGKCISSSARKEDMSKKKRIWNKKDYCYFCETEVMKFSRHILRHHSNESKVAEILSLDKGNKKRKFLFNKLRNEGNFLKAAYNEPIIPVRKPVLGSTSPVHENNYLPCKYCKGFYKKKFLYRHVKKCPHNSERMKINRAQSEGQSLLSNYIGNSILSNKVFPSMRGDAISLVAKKDNLICAIAERYLKSHKGKQFHQVASRKMRQLGNLLIELRKTSSNVNLLGALEPDNFDNLVRCTKIISKYDEKTETYESPSLAANMGTLLKECIDVAHTLLLKTKNIKDETLKKLTNLKELITSEWRYEVSTIANNDLQQKKWNKPSLIPLGEDLSLLKSYLSSEIIKYSKILTENENNAEAFVRLQELTYVQLIFLNRRRVGELQRMTLHSYVTNIKNDTPNEFESCINESEKILMRSFRRIIIKGKRNRGVPVLFTAPMVKCTDFLVKVRENFVAKDNIYLFANIKSCNSISGSQVIHKHVRLAGAKNPAALTSTKLRKHLATMSQVINLSQQDLEQLAGFMGHTTDIHKTYYRLPNDIYQTAKISKLLILCEKGHAAKFKGKSLEEIDLDLHVEEEESSEDDEAPDFCSLKKLNQEEILSSSTSSKSVEPDTKSIIANKRRRILEPWNDNQKEITLDFFKYNIANKIPPRKEECVKLKNSYQTIFGNKSWEKIKIYVVNKYNKLDKK